jgi:hypothetical protein
VIVQITGLFFQFPQQPFDDFPQQLVAIDQSRLLPAP